MDGRFACSRSSSPAWFSNPDGAFRGSFNFCLSPAPNKPSIDRQNSAFHAAGVKKTHSPVWTNQIAQFCLSEPDQRVPDKIAIQTGGPIARNPFSYTQEHIQEKWPSPRFLSSPPSALPPRPAPPALAIRAMTRRHARDPGPSKKTQSRAFIDRLGALAPYRLGTTSHRSKRLGEALQADRTDFRHNVLGADFWGVVCRGAD